MGPHPPCGPSEPIALAGASLEFAEIRDCDPPLVKTCLAFGAVLRVREVFRFLLEHQSLGVTLVLLLLVPAGSVISRRLFSMAATKQERSQSSRWKCR